MSAQSPTIFEQFNSGVESIFSTLGNLTDGATSILGDYMEMESLWGNEADQASGGSGQTSFWGQPTQDQGSSSVVSGGASSTTLLTYAAFGLVGLGAVSLLMGK